jgi:branched-chain amino acid transport system ATP-binding protein
MVEPLLAAEQITVRFGGLTALDDVGLEVGAGEIVGLIGPNGAGKTTLFGCVVGSLRRVAGSVRFDGADVSEWPAHRRARAGIGRTFQRAQIFGSMTVRENLEFATEAPFLGEHPWRLLTRRRHRAETEAAAVLEALELGAVAEVPAGRLPLGVLRLVEFGRALCARPKLLLLDEPSSGLDVDETATLGSHIRAAVAERGIGVLLIEHDMSLVLGVSQRLYVLDFGRILFHGSPEDVAASHEVQQAYLGTAGAR